jgi:adenosylcobinamide amidohydrolase
MNWEILLAQPAFTLRRSGRFVVAELTGPHVVLSTSAKNGGQVVHVRWLVNHQSCEGAGHLDRHDIIVNSGADGYHDAVCAEIDLPAGEAAVMGTAANMNYTSWVNEADGDVGVTAVVTAGVEGNATTAGEPATWRETADGIRSVQAVAGTINTMLLIDRPLTAAALARAVMTMTEGKTAALQRLAVPSKRHIDLATGTGTDQYCIAVPIAGPGPSGTPLTSASPHMKLGESIGRATRDATLEALRWQNGLEASYTRGLFHALGRYGVREATIFDDAAPFLSAGDLELLRKNSKAAFYEPLVGAAAHALAAVCERVRHGTLPESVVADAMAQQAANLAASLAAQVDRWPEFRSALRVHASADVKTLVLRAVALGWSAKWRSGDGPR